ncbi:MAG: protein kinase, partial [Myxococcales bacterium]|nr:protein kinase [Myxococcales bacterium]
MGPKAPPEDFGASAFPARYEPIERLGKGGGGEVWAARDRVGGQVVALKLLRDGADTAEMRALVREATLLSGIEGLGVPRVLHFGRLPGSGRAFMARELVEGRSLADILGEGTTRLEPTLAAVAQAADLVTRLHRSLLLHGDIKPANIIVGPSGEATLVDLGLAAPWQEGGTQPQGLTPRYAAPELFRAEPLSPRAEVYALGATLHEVLRHTESDDEELIAAVEAVAARATEEAASARYPSADEFAEALRRAARLPLVGHAGAVWSIVGVEEMSALLLDRVQGLSRGAGLVLAGNHGSGRSTLLRRLAWSLGVGGASVALLDDETPDLAAALDIVVPGDEARRSILLVDDADAQSEAGLARLAELREAGAIVVAVVAPTKVTALVGPTFQLFEMPALADDEASALVRRMIPSLGDKLVDYIVARAGGLPGLMRTIVERLEGHPVVSAEDVEQYLAEVPVPSGARIPTAEIQRLLERGLFDIAADYLEAYEEDPSVAVGLLRAKLATGRGDPKSALKELRRIESSLGSESDEKARWHVEMARASLRTGDYEDAETHAGLALTRLGASLLGTVASGHFLEQGGDQTMTAMVSEALAISGIASFVGSFFATWG